MILPDLDSKKSLVTGANGAIGGAVVSALLGQGCSVFGLDITFPAGSSGLEDYRSISCDLSDPGQISAAFREVRSETEHLDFVVNIAGIDPKLSLSEGTGKEWGRIMDVNLRAYYLVIREAVELLKAGSGKSIVNVSSINYRLGIPRRSIYSVSKAGILGLTTGLARELGKDGIRINTVSPGWVFTPKQVEEYFTRPDDRAKYEPYLEEHQAISHRITPDDIARHILFYLSEASAASTGHNCVVDGGWLLE